MSQPPTSTVTTIIPSLIALLEHPDFQQGMINAQERFLENHKSAPLTEDEMIEEVEIELSRGTVEISRAMGRMLEFKPEYEQYSYLYNLGFVFGTINEGLSYASTPC